MSLSIFLTPEAVGCRSAFNQESALALPYINKFSEFVCLFHFYFIFLPCSKAKFEFLNLIFLDVNLCKNKQKQTKNGNLVVCLFIFA